MRRKVRGLRDIERQVLEDRRQAPVPSEPTASAGSGSPLPVGPADEAAGVVLDYCSVVRGILNDDQGGPLHPPGLRMG